MEPPTVAARDRSRRGGRPDRRGHRPRRLRQGSAPAPAPGPAGRGPDDRAQDHPLHADVRRADGELAPGEHRRARVGLPRQDRLPGGRARQAGAGDVPARHQALHRAAQRRAGRTAGNAGAAHYRGGHVRPREAAHRAGRAAADRPGPREGRARLRARRRLLREGEGRASAAQRGLRDDHVAGHGAGKPRAATPGRVRQLDVRQREPHLRRRDRPDLGELQRVAEPGGEVEGDGAQGPDHPAQGRELRRRRRAARRDQVPVPRQDQLLRSRRSARTPARSWCAPCSPTRRWNCGRACS